MSESRKKSTAIHITANSVVASLFHYLTEEYLFLKANNEESDLSFLANIRKRTAEATGFSEDTVDDILEEERLTKEKERSKSLENNQDWPLPPANKKPRHEEVVEIKDEGPDYYK